MLYFDTYKRGGRWKSVHITSDTNWTVPAGVYMVVARAVAGGAGGGGGHSSSGRGGAGAGGGEIKQRELVVNPGDVLACYPGTKGTGGAVEAAGNAGNDSYIQISAADVIRARGGLGGSPGAASGTAIGGLGGGLREATSDKHGIGSLGGATGACGGNTSEGGGTCPGYGRGGLDPGGNVAYGGAGGGSLGDGADGQASDAAGNAGTQGSGGGGGYANKAGGNGGDGFIDLFYVE